MIVLALDLGVFSKSNKAVTFKNALSWTSVWVSFAIMFFLLLKQYGHLIHGIMSQDQLIALAKNYQPDMDFSKGDFASEIIRYNDRISLDFLTGYFIEYSLSVDNLFVILLIFSSFAVPPVYYKKVLFWGVLGAIVLRMLFIFSGSMLIAQFHWILYLFGAFLVFSGLKILWTKDEDEKMDTEKHPMVRLASKYFYVHPEYVK